MAELNGAQKEGTLQSAKKHKPRDSERSEESLLPSTGDFSVGVK